MQRQIQACGLAKSSKHASHKPRLRERRGAYFERLSTSPIPLTAAFQLLVRLLFQGGVDRRILGTGMRHSCWRISTMWEGADRAVDYHPLSLDLKCGDVVADM